MNQNVHNMNLDELLKAAIKDPAMRSPFLQSLIKSDVYVICKNPVKQERDRSEGGIQLELVRTVEAGDRDLASEYGVSHGNDLRIE